MNDLVTIIGRPNVGKSTLFNRLTETRDAITDPTAGTTRDRKYGKALWGGRVFTVIDTGGYATGTDDVFEGVIREQVQTSMEEAALIVFMVDAQTGITDLDQDIAQLVRRTGKPVMLVVNKIDTGAQEYATAEFYGLGIGDELFGISANNGYGTGDLLDALREVAQQDTGRDLQVLAIPAGEDGLAFITATLASMNLHHLISISFFLIRSSFFMTVRNDSFT